MGQTIRFYRTEEVLFRGARFPRYTIGVSLRFSFQDSPINPFANRLEKLFRCAPAEAADVWKAEHRVRVFLHPLLALFVARITRTVASIRF